MKMVCVALLTKIAILKSSAFLFKKGGHSVPVPNNAPVTFLGSSITDPDPGSGAFLTPGSGIRDG